MTDREKIIKIIKKNGTFNGGILSFDYYVVQPEILADALIANGIGDVSEWKRRAEVAERALGFICDKAMKNHDIIVFPEDGMQTKSKAELFTYCIERAERELAEERKDD